MLFYHSDPCFQKARIDKEKMMKEGMVFLDKISGLLKSVPAHFTLVCVMPMRYRLIERFYRHEILIIKRRRISTAYLINSTFIETFTSRFASAPPLRKGEFSMAK